ncbi:MAG: signal peptide peptidase SppA [Woeseiaceae bacterium]|nr:signal peptide peptidase SppA [Woeseiaceae bacterium]
MRAYHPDLMFSLIRNIIHIVWTGADALRKALHLVILLFIFSIVFGAIFASTPAVPGSAALVIRPNGRLVEQLAGDPFTRALGELTGDADPETLVRDIIDGLEYAKDDARITSVMLDLSALPGGGLSKLSRVADAIEDFRDSGKPVIAKADYFGQGNYYLAAHADEIYMHPEGVLAFYGFGAYLNYYKDALDKLQIDWNVFQAGTYKSAVEPYTRNDMSDTDRAALGNVIDQLWSQYKTDIESARSLEPGTIDSALDDLITTVESTGGDLAQIALDFNLVDGLWTRDQVSARMIEVAGSNGDDSTYPAVGLDNYLHRMRLLKGDVVAAQNIGVIVASGEILYGDRDPGTIGGDTTARLLREVRQDDSVKAVVLRVDSPGGSLLASEVIRDEVLALREAGKPVVASMSSIAASGGYWVSMSADRIYATPYTITGSIGVFGMFASFERSLDALGISTDGIATTPWAGQLRPDRTMSEEGKAIFQAMIDRDYADFVSHVADSRGMSEDFVDSIAQGRIWTGNDALANGLVDELGELEQAIAAAGELAGLDAGAAGLKYFERKLDPVEKMMLDMLGGAQAWGIDITRFARPSSAVERLAGVVEEVLSPLTRFNDPKGVYSHCFCAFD